MRIGSQTDPDTFRCERCGNVWKQFPLPMGVEKGFISAADPCRECGSLYMKWLNWKPE